MPAESGLRDEIVGRGGERRAACAQLGDSGTVAAARERDEEEEGRRDEMRCYLAGAYAECNREEASRCAHREENELSSGGTARSSGGDDLALLEMNTDTTIHALQELRARCLVIGLERERDARERCAERGEIESERETREDTGPQRRGGMCACVRRASAWDERRTPRGTRQQY